ncbi:MAG: S49 family peptidase [Planctomycetes bacterium]|nr:S49 family peptidase [Planctomycetota bacterium]
MSSSQMPPGGPPAGGPPPGVPPQPRNGAAWPQATPAPRESRGVSFFIAVFLGILLVASAGLNVLLLLVSVGSLAGGGAIGGDDDGVYDEVHVAGERGEKARILQVSLHGAIAEGASPVIGAAGGSVSQVRRALRQAEKDDIAGVLLDINSPGGGVTDSDEIYDLIARFRRDHPDKPVISLFGDMAASGGYYVAAASEHILARRTTITGSIGVIMSAWNFAEAAKKFGVEQVAIKSDRTPMKDILSPTRPCAKTNARCLPASSTSSSIASSQSSTRAARRWTAPRCSRWPRAPSTRPARRSRMALSTRSGTTRLPSRGLRRSSARRSRSSNVAAARASRICCSADAQKRLRSNSPLGNCSSVRPGPASSTSGKVADEQSLVEPPGAL